jgi:DNA-directed RNA polymerase subunit RPC12/RpoP
MARCKSCCSKILFKPLKSAKNFISLYEAINA